MAQGVTAGLGYKDVLICADVVLQESVGNDHVDSGRLYELSNFDLLDVSEVGDELECQVAGRLAGAALANRVSLDHHELPMEVREHTQALIDKLLASKRFALAIEQNGITFDLGQRKVRFIRGDDEFQQLRYDVGSVINFRRARKSGETADVGDQDDRLFSHGKGLLRRAAGGHAAVEAPTTLMKSRRRTVNPESRDCSGTHSSCQQRPLSRFRLALAAATALGAAVISGHDFA
jgi:hypothetical protein